jgi:peptidoglycan-N-acetylglucosamine deacetylase
VFGADLWASDWNRMTPNQELRLVMERLDANRGGIVLFHDTKRQTATMLPAFLRALKASGYRIVHVVVDDAGKRSQSDHALSTKN